MEKITKAQVKLVRSLQQKKFRDELSLFVAEGEKCVSELCKAFQLEMLIIVEGLEFNQSLFSQAKTAYMLSAKRSDIEQISSLRTPQGVIGVFKKPSHSEAVLQSEGRSYSVNGLTAEGGQHLTLALDAIQDPGNLGTIIRTCDWFGVHDIFCSLDTADCYNPKVVQATMGALARVRLHYVDLPKWLNDQTNGQMVNDQMVNIFGTLLDGQNMYEVLQRSGLTAERSYSPKDGLTAEGGHAVIIMGNEGNGISNEVRQFITHPIRIPSYPKNVETSESLNVSIATAIVLAEFRRSYSGAVLQ